MFPQDVERQILLKSVDVSESYSKKIKIKQVQFFETQRALLMLIIFAFCIYNLPGRPSS